MVSSLLFDLKRGLMMLYL